MWWGLFINREDWIESSLERRPQGGQHITFGYKVDIPDNLPFGEDIPVLITGYANDGMNEGVSVEFPEYLNEFFYASDTPHITLSMSKGARSADTALLCFEAIEPYFVHARFGVYDFKTGLYIPE